MPRSTLGPRLLNMIGIGAESEASAPVDPYEAFGVAEDIATHSRETVLRLQGLFCKGAAAQKAESEELLRMVRSNAKLRAQALHNAKALLGVRVSVLSWRGAASDSRGRGRSRKRVLQVCTA